MITYIDLDHGSYLGWLMAAVLKRFGMSAAGKRTC